MGMTFEDCIEYMESEYECIKDDDMVMEEDIKAYEMTLNTMRKYQQQEQEPTTKNDLGVDAVSRQAVLDLINADWKYEGLEIEINNLPSVTPQEPRWIPVSERLPEDYEDVLVSGEDIVKQAQFIKGIFECEDDGVYALVYALLSDEKVIDADFTFKALAWRPLPKPYEPQESEG